MDLNEISKCFSLAINTNKQNIIEILKIKYKQLHITNSGNKRIILKTENNTIYLEDNEDFDYNLSINDCDGFLYFQTYLYFIPENNVKIQQQIDLAKSIKYLFDNHNFLCDIIAEFEPYL